MKFPNPIRHTQHLKVVGHDYIDEIVSLGIPRHRIYKKLSRALKWPRNITHFSAIEDPLELERMIEALRRYRNDILKRRALAAKKEVLRKEPFKPQVLPFKLQQAGIREVAHINQLRRKHWILARFFPRLFSRLVDRTRLTPN